MIASNLATESSGGLNPAAHFIQIAQKIPGYPGEKWIVILDSTALKQVRKRPPHLPVACQIGNQAANHKVTGRLVVRPRNVCLSICSHWRGLRGHWLSGNSMQNPMVKHG